MEDHGAVGVTQELRSRHAANAAKLARSRRSLILVGVAVVALAVVVAAVTLR